MRLSLSDKLVMAAAITFGVAAVLLPLEFVEVLGAPLVVAGAYFGGRRGGLLVALWAVRCASAATSSAWWPRPRSRPTPPHFRRVWMPRSKLPAPASASASA